MFGDSQLVTPMQELKLSPPAVLCQDSRRQRRERRTQRVLACMTVLQHPSGSRPRPGGATSELCVRPDTPQCVPLPSILLTSSTKPTRFRRCRLCARRHAVSWHPGECQSRGSMGTCLCASDTSAVSKAGLLSQIPLHICRNGGTLLVTDPDERVDICTMRPVKQDPRRHLSSLDSFGRLTPFFAQSVQTTSNFVFGGISVPEYV